MERLRWEISDLKINKKIIKAIVSAKNDHRLKLDVIRRDECNWGRSQNNE